MRKHTLIKLQMLSILNHVINSDKKLFSKLIINDLKKLQKLLIILNNKKYQKSINDLLKNQKENSIRYQNYEPKSIFYTKPLNTNSKGVQLNERKFVLTKLNNSEHFDSNKSIEFPIIHSVPGNIQSKSITDDIEDSTVISGAPYGISSNSLVLGQMYISSTECCIKQFKPNPANEYSKNNSSVNFSDVLEYASKENKTESKDNSKNDFTKDLFGKCVHYNSKLKPKIYQNKNISWFENPCIINTIGKSEAPNTTDIKSFITEDDSLFAFQKEKVEDYHLKLWLKTDLNNDKIFEESPNLYHSFYYRKNKQIINPSCHDNTLKFSKTSNSETCNKGFEDKIVETSKKNTNIHIDTSLKPNTQFEIPLEIKKPLPISTLSTHDFNLHVEPQIVRENEMICNNVLQHDIPVGTQKTSSKTWNQSLHLKNSSMIHEINESDKIKQLHTTHTSKNPKTDVPEESKQLETLTFLNSIDCETSTLEDEILEKGPINEPQQTGEVHETTENTEDYTDYCSDNLLDIKVEQPFELNPEVEKYPTLSHTITIYDDTQFDMIDKATQTDISAPPDDENILNKLVGYICLKDHEINFKRKKCCFVFTN